MRPTQKFTEKRSGFVSAVRGGFRAFSCSAPQGRRKVSVPFSVPRDVPKNRLRFGGKVAEQRRSRLQGPARASVHSVVSQLAARLLCSRACRVFRSSVSCRFFLSRVGFVSSVRRGFAASSPIYIAPFSLKTFLSCQNRSERGGFEPRRGQGTGTAPPKPPLGSGGAQKGGAKPRRAGVQMVRARHFEWPAGRRAGRTLAAFQPVVGLSPVSGEGVGAAACGGSGGSPRPLSSPGWSFQSAAPRARTRMPACVL